MNSPANSAERELFGDALVVQDMIPARFRPIAVAPQLALRMAERAEAVLRSLGLTDEISFEESEDHTHQDLTLQRIEARLSLVLELLGALLRRQNEALPIQFLKWSRHGLSLPAAEAVSAGSAGVIELQPSPSLPQIIELPVKVLTHGLDTAGLPQLWLRFDPLPLALEAALDRQIFRLHRRAVASERRRRP